MSEDALRKQANALYWDSDQSVNHIAEEMDLSKGRLYELILPLPSGSACPECSAMTQYSNRTAREKHTVTCPECAGKGVESKPQTPALVSDGPSLELEYAGPRSDPRIGTRVLLGAALLGAAVGLYAMTRRRR